MGSSSALDIIVKARDEASSTLRGVGSEATHMGSTVTKSAHTASSAGSRMGSSFKTAARTIGAAIGVIGIEQFATHAIDAFELVNKGTERMAFALGKVGGGKAQVAGIVSWAQTFSRSTATSEGSILDLSSKLATMGQGVLKAFGPSGAQAVIQSMTGGLIDMASATGKSTQMLMRSLAPSILNTPTKAVSLLEKLGAITGKGIGQAAAFAAKDNAHIKLLIKSGAVTKAYGEAIMHMSAKQKQQNLTAFEGAAIQAKFAGATKAAMTPMEYLKNWFNQLEIAAGRFIDVGLKWIITNGQKFIAWFHGASGGAKVLHQALHIAAAGARLLWAGIKLLVAGIVTVISFIVKLVGWFARHKEVTLALAAALGAVAVAIGVELVAALVLLTITFYNMAAAAVAAWFAATWPVLAVIAGVALVGVAVFELVKHWRGAWHAIQTAVHVAWAFIKKTITLAWHAIFKVLSFTPLLSLFRVGWTLVKGVVKAAWTVITGYFRMYWTIIKGIVHVGILAVRDVIVPVLKFISDHWSSIWNGMKGVFSDVWGALVGIAKPVVNALIALLNGIIGGINDVINAYNVIPGHSNVGNIPKIPALATGGLVTRTGLAIVDRGETFSGVGGARGGDLTVVLDRRRFVDSGDFHVKFKGY